MPTHEQYIEAARRKLDPYFMWSLDSTNDRTIKFNHNEVYITEKEAEAVALEPKAQPIRYSAIRNIIESHMSNFGEVNANHLAQAITDHISVLEPRKEDIGHCDYPCDADKGYKLICNACTKGVSLLVKEPKQEHDHDENCGTKHDHDRGSCEECDSVFEAGWNRCREHLAKNDNNIATYLAGKASHDHNTCELCLSSRKGAGDAGYDLGYNKGFEAGKALRKPFDVDALAKFIANTSDGSSRIMAQDIADHFAAPERKPICETQVRAAMKTGMLNYLPGDVRNVTKALNEVLDLQQPIDDGKAWSMVRSMISSCDRLDNEDIEQWYARLDIIAQNIVTRLQPTPVEAERCPECEHVVGADAKGCIQIYCRCTNEFHRERGTV